MGLDISKHGERHTADLVHIEQLVKDSSVHNGRNGVVYPSAVVHTTHPSADV